MPRFMQLADWLSWQETLHPRKIDLGLERVARVAERLNLLQPKAVVVTVAGTNGKGSCVTLLETIYRAAGYRVGSYQSPHLLRYNERIRVNGSEVNDDILCQAFQAVDDSRGQESLTYFEFGTLAALEIFSHHDLDIILLEVGMGGRLDAVNIVAADAALVTRIGIDHGQWLGDDRESIGREKAGIFRANRPAICCDPDPPASLRQTAASLGAPWLSLGRDFTVSPGATGWRWSGVAHTHDGLPYPAVPGQHQLDNAAGVLMVAEVLEEKLPVPRPAIQQGLRTAALPGRCQFFPGPVETVLDVAHNPQSAQCLVRVLNERPRAGQTHLVLGMLEDKDIRQFAGIMRATADHWYFGSLQGERGLSAEALRERSGVARGECFRSIAAALQQARSRASRGDRIVVCGSFRSVAEAMACTV